MNHDMTFMTKIELKVTVPRSIGTSFQGMGALPSTEAVSVVPDGEDPNSPFSTRRHPRFKDQTLQNPPNLQTMQDVCLRQFRKWSERPCMGCRERNGDQLANEFTFLSFKECEEIAYNLGSGIIELLQVGPEGRVGVYSDPRMEWGHMVNESNLYGHALVSLYDTFGENSIGELIKHSQMEVIFASPVSAEKLVKVLGKDRHRIRHVIVFEDKGRPITNFIKEFNNMGIECCSFNAVCEVGKAHRHPLPKIDAEWVHFICYSSGTTGVPKGIIVSHRSSVNNLLNCYDSIAPHKDSRHLSYLPLAHVFERSGVSTMAHAGGMVGFYSGQIPRLMEDMQILKPTHLCAVPRVLSRIYDQVMTELATSNSIKRAVFWTAWYWKRFWKRRGYEAALSDLLVFRQIIAKTGGCLDQFVIGGAALDAWTHEFIQVLFGIPVRAGYGLSELGSGNVVNPFNYWTSKPGTCGGPMPNLELRLEPLADYEDPKCGELICGGQMLCSGYLFDEEQTEKLFVDKERKWVRTGDIGKWDKDGYLMVVDRIRSIFKLSQGEFVAADLITLSYERAVLITQIFIYGDASRPCLVGIVVPARKPTAALFGVESMTDEEFIEACKTEKLREAIRAQLDEIAVEQKFPGYERIRRIACEPEEWTTTNDYVTPTFKLRRRKLTLKYKAQIERLYQELA
jgi:long-chain acyl-CoA synthetase